MFYHVDSRILTEIFKINYLKIYNMELTFNLYSIDWILKSIFIVSFIQGVINLINFYSVHVPPRLGPRQYTEKIFGDTIGIIRVRPSPPPKPGVIYISNRIKINTFLRILQFFFIILFFILSYLYLTNSFDILSFSGNLEIYKLKYR